MSIATDRPSLPASSAADGDNDPFVGAPSQIRQRFSTFDHQVFALSPGSSPAHVKRALEAHLAETERRMEEAGKLGTALVQQRKELSERLKEVEKLQTEGELGPDLRKKLVEIEREYNDVARETARAFLPKQRVPSNEANPGSPYVPDGRSGRRSVSPSKFESQATGSPTKFSVPNRKLRNQPANRIHDIEFAAEISTSLISQVRNLQALLAEKEEELRDAKTENSKLEIESEGFQQRVKTLDESEHRYKDENWNLETQIQELIAREKDAQDREKKLTQSLNVIQAEKNKAQRELDEVKLSHSKLAEDHAAAIKTHDIELGTVKRSMASAENERATMQRKIEDLTSQNQELARAFSSQRARALEMQQGARLSDDDLETAADHVTPEHSPPPSPIKGTPRHSVLESETLKSSLQHAQRTLQSQRTQLHREKTEKLELKRMLQDARDELEKLRSESGGLARRAKKSESRELKKPPRLLGAHRSSRDEIYFEEDPDWEDHQDESRRSPSNPAFGSRSGSSGPSVIRESIETDHFETANETSDAFETANERGTETEDFQTGAEEISGSDGALTETEGPSAALRRPPSGGFAMRHMTRESFHSTASTSNDEDEQDASELRTPTISQPPQKMRLRISRSLLAARRSRQVSEEPAFQGSPASYGNSSASGTPQPPAQSLFAELAEFEGSDDDSLGGTPSRVILGSSAPSLSARPLNMPGFAPRPVMVDSAVMTDADVSPETPTTATLRPTMVDAGVMTEEIQQDPVLSEAGAKASLVALPTHADRSVALLAPATPSSRDSFLSLSQPDDAESRRYSYMSYSDAGAQHDPELESKLASFPMPPSKTIPILTMSSIVAEHVEPIPEPAEQAIPPPVLALSIISAQSLEPIAEPVPRPKTPPPLVFAGIQQQGLSPIAEPAAPPAKLVLSPIQSETSAPVPEPEPTPPCLDFSRIESHDLAPVAEPERPLAPLTLSLIRSETWAPVAEPLARPATPPSLGMSSITSQALSPVVEPATPPSRPVLAFSTIRSQESVPIVAPETKEAPAAPTLSVTDIRIVNDIQPRADPEPVYPTLSFSSVVSESVETIDPPAPAAQPGTQFEFSRIESIATSPVSPRSPKRDGMIFAYDLDNPLVVDDAVHTPANRHFNPILAWSGKRSSTPPLIAEDETRQSPRDTPQPETPDSQRPFKEMSANANARPIRKARLPPVMTDQSSQTMLTSDILDEIMQPKPKTSHDYSHERNLSLGSTMGTPGTVRIRRPSQDSIVTTGSVRRHRTKVTETPVVVDAPLRPDSAASSHEVRDVPPLPANHLEAIEAARTGSAGGGSSGIITPMGPPLWPASVLKQRPKTPTAPKPISTVTVAGTPTPRAVRTGVTPHHGHADIHSSTRFAHKSQQSSMSSFASEIDSRFNMGAGEGMYPGGLGPNTDPRMIQAITQTMIGEYLWKYTRKTGRGGMSENRHRRYFWVHPYNRTLYWSDHAPSTTGRVQDKSKSVQIEAVRVVTDDNVMPPGLYRKSLVIIAPGRTIKFTCPTGKRHEVWFNALSYLLLRTGDEVQSDAEEIAGNITREDVDEFNPSFPGQRRQPSERSRSRPPPSLSSYNSRAAASRTESPAFGYSTMDIPTLTPANRNGANATLRSSGGGTLSRISGYWKSNQMLSGTFSSLRSRSSTRPALNIYEESEVHDSAEDLRAMIERQDREADRLENVRACCDGKHDVGTLSHSGKHHPRPRLPFQLPSETPTPSGTMRSRA